MTVGPLIGFHTSYTINSYTYESTENTGITIAAGAGRADSRNGNRS